jgi:hypothetical protein
MRHEAVVEDRDLAVEQERRGLKRGHRGGELREPAGQITPVPADEPHAGGVLVGEDASAVDLLLVDPARPVEGLADLGGGHRGPDVGEAGHGPRSLPVSASLRALALNRPATGVLIMSVPRILHEGRSRHAPYDRLCEWSARSPGSCTLFGLTAPSIPLSPRTASRSRRWAGGFGVGMRPSMDSTGSRHSSARRTSRPRTSSARGGRLPCGRSTRSRV